jgi:GNAT superfamily N-acetyltransferase
MAIRGRRAQYAAMTLAFRIRDAKLPDERPRLLEFIMGSQAFEHAIEPDRRLDARVADDYYAELVPRALKRNGRILVADAAREGLVGWAVVHEQENEVFVVEDERLYGYVSELFVAETARGIGVGRALLAACDDWGRERKLKLMMIGVLAGNRRAAEIYAQAGFAPYALQLRKYLAR